MVLDPRMTVRQNLGSRYAISSAFPDPNATAR
jgi:hypothetical protein